MIPSSESPPPNPGVTAGVVLSPPPPVAKSLPFLHTGPPECLAHWREGYQVVFGVRRKREQETALKKLTSFLFYRLMRKIADVKIPADTGDFRLMDRRVLEVYAQLQEDPRFFRGLVSWIG